jgi:hypothetical protein
MTRQQGFDTSTPEDRVAATAQLFMRIAQDAGWFVSPDNRIALEHAAVMLGLAPGTLRNKCAAGEGPRVYHLGGKGHRVTVHLLDLAAWRESHRT